MKFSTLIAGAASVAGVLAAPADQSVSVDALQKRAGKFLFTGVSVAGGEFGNKDLPGQLGKHYTWPEKSAIDTLKAQGLNTFRIAFMMERVVPTKLTGTVNETYFAGLEDTIKYVTSKGSYAVLDPHNFGRYYDKIITDVAGFKAWWKTVATRFKDNKLVIFDTNNEYHDMDNSLVAQLNQAAIDGIREAGAMTQYIYVEGNAWTGAWHWVDSGTGASLKDLKDPADATGNLIIYQMHQYLDSDGSGTAATCVSATIGAERIATATKWLKDNKKRGLIGETAGGANAQCIGALGGMLQSMLDNSDVWTGVLLWSSGKWWADYMFSMEPPSGTMYTGVFPSLKKYLQV